MQLICSNLSLLWQHLLPKHWLTVLAGKLASKQLGWFTIWLIRRFIQHYAVNMQEAQLSSATDYASFNDFFTRALRPDARPLAVADWISPVDGEISQFGQISQGQLLQAKGHTYALSDLLADDLTLCQRLQGGNFITLYLSPRDYHRIHMPHQGSLRSMRYIPGSLYSVNQRTVARVQRLFARNERVICEFTSPQGHFVMVLVGATIVGSIATTWHGLVNPKNLIGSDTSIQQKNYAEGEVTLEQGEEMGRFLLGSTVILITEQQSLQFKAGLQSGQPIRLGQSLSP